jgi:Protein of unknown function (DUF3500)
VTAASSPRRRAAAHLVAAAVSLAVGPSAVSPASAQQPGGFDPMGMARRALAEPFVGVTTGGAPRADLYAVAPTGVPTAPVVEAARALLAALDPARREAIRFPVVDDAAWRNWANIHRFPREGVPLADMTPAQREAAHALLRASLSAKGYQTSRDIMRLNHHLAELVSNFDDYGEHLYWFAVFGEPSPDAPWGWQIEGHHLIVNYFVLGDQVVMTPTFMGSEPVAAASGAYAGVSVLRPEQDLALTFVRSLPPEQQAAARIRPDKGRAENLAEMFKDNVVIPPAGLAAAEMGPAHREALAGLIGLYVGNLREGHAAARMGEVRAHLDETRFAWIGGTGEDAVFYYRIHSPVILIEFDHQGPIALDGPRGVPTRRHVHTVVRTPNGGDYGADLLRRHHLEHDHRRGGHR